MVGCKNHIAILINRPHIGICPVRFLAVYLAVCTVHCIGYGNFDGDRRGRVDGGAVFGQGNIKSDGIVHYIQFLNSQAGTDKAGRGVEKGDRHRRRAQRRCEKVCRPGTPVHGDQRIDL